MFPGIREDIQTVMQRDPAATSAWSVWFNAPAMHAIWAYRRHHWLWNHGFKGLARWLSTRSRRKFGVEIHPGAQIGRRFMIDHGMGVVIGETTIIGDDCMLYQGVTLGGTGKDTGKRHPTLGNNVLVGVNAVVLGNITVGDNAKIGGGTVVVHDVPAGSTFVGLAGREVVRKKKVELFKFGYAAARARKDQVHQGSQAGHAGQAAAYGASHGTVHVPGMDQHLPAGTSSLAENLERQEQTGQDGAAPAMYVI